MPLDEDLDNAAGSIRDFEEALAAATETLLGLDVGETTSVGVPGGEGGGDGAGGGGGGRGGRGGGGRRGVGARLASFGVAAVLGAADDFATGVVSTGQVGTGIGTATRGALGLAAVIPGVGGITGARQAEKTLGRAEGRVGGALADLARQGLVVTDEMIQQDLDVVIAQERRATEVEARVRGATGSAENVSVAAPDNTLVSQIANMAETLEKIFDTLSGLTGGSAR